VGAAILRTGLQQALGRLRLEAPAPAGSALPPAKDLLRPHAERIPILRTPHPLPRWPFVTPCGQCARLRPQCARGGTVVPGRMTRVRPARRSTGSAGHVAEAGARWCPAAATTSWPRLLPNQGDPAACADAPNQNSWRGWSDHSLWPPTDLLGSAAALWPPCCAGSPFCPVHWRFRWRTVAMTLRSILVPTPCLALAWDDAPVFPHAPVRWGPHSPCLRRSLGLLDAPGEDCCFRVALRPIRWRGRPGGHGSACGLLEPGGLVL